MLDFRRDEISAVFALTAGGWVVNSSGINLADEPGRAGAMAPRGNLFYRVFALAMMLVAPGMAPAASALPFVNAYDVSMRAGDDPRWADPALDDSSWSRMEFGDVPAIDGIVNIRARVQLDSRDFVAGHPTGLFVGALASCEIAWDGAIIGQSGHPAVTASAEIPGPVQSQWVIPDRLATLGAHVLALRCSAHHRHFTPRSGYWVLLVGDYDALTWSVQVATQAALTSLSGMLMVGVFALVMFLVDRRDRSFLLLGLVCVCGAALLLAESWRTLFGYTYDWHLTRLLAITALTALLNLAIMGFVVVRYRGRFAQPVLLALLVCLALALLAPSWDAKTLAMFLAGLTLAVCWMLRAVWRGQRGSVAALVGLAATLAAVVWSPLAFADLGLYLGLDFLLACLLVGHAMQVRAFRREHDEALVKSARLEIELLRKHIQPHFLMNTLTALSEWIEQEPAVAVSMIDALAEEFRILARIADRSLIELGEELDLCRTHLAIMSRRRGREYALTVAGVDTQNLVPPAIFHTLVENAITHDASNHARITLALRATDEGSRTRYVFEAPSEAGGPAREEGTGLRYIRARLRESFGDDWSLVAGPVNGVWRTEIAMARRR